MNDAGASEKQASYVVKNWYGDGVEGELRNLVYSKWKRSYRVGNDYIKLANQESFFRAYDQYISQILNRINTIVRFAVLSDAPDVVLGFAVVERLNGAPRPNCLHYVHVHKYQRHQGIARKLIGEPKDIYCFTHLTRIGLQLWSKIPDAIFDPFA